MMEFSDETSQSHNLTEVLMTTQQPEEGGNITNGTARDETLARVEIIILSSILYMALFGNGLVLLVLKLRFQKLSRMHWFIAHLAIADLFVAFFHILPQLIWDITGEFHGNDALCRLVSLFQVVAMCASSFVLVTTAIDRYISICHPLTSQILSSSHVHKMIAVAWTLSVLVSLPQVFIFKLEETEEDFYQCWATYAPGWGLQAYITYMFLAVYIIPCLLLAFCYGRICLKVWASIAFKESSSSFRQPKKIDRSSSSSQKSFRFRVSFRQMHNQNSTMMSEGDGLDQSKRMLTPPRKQSRGRLQGISKAKVKTVKMTLTVVLTYLICWAPFFFCNIISVYGNIDYEAHYMVIIMLLASLNSCTNPWIYMAFSGRMCPRKKDRRVSRSYITSTQVSYGCDTLETTTILHGQTSDTGHDLPVMLRHGTNNSQRHRDTT